MKTLIVFSYSRPIAVGALLTTVAACVCIIIQSLLDHREDTTYGTEAYKGDVDYPDATIMGWVKAFSTIMFAFAGASTFPTIQADMKHKDQFKISALVACTSEKAIVIFQLSYCESQC